jgi:hypothetical protein
MIQWLLVKNAFVRAWRWVHDNALWLVLMVIGAATGAALMRRKDSQVSTLKEALSVEKAKGQLERLRGERDGILQQDAGLVARDAGLKERAELLENEMRARKQEIVHLHDKKLNLAYLSDEQLEAEFRRVGL